MELKVLQALPSFLKEVNLRGLLLSTNDYPQIISDDISDAKAFVFGSSPITISTFDGTSNYYHLIDKGLIFPVNKIATYFKRLYTQNYSPLNIITGDVLVYSSEDSMPHIIDFSVQSYFIDQVMAYFVSHDYAFTKH